MPDSPTASLSSLSHRYRFSNTGSDDALSLLKRWLQDCQTNHDQCKQSAYDKYPPKKDCILPARVIDVGPGDGTHQPRLHTTRGTRGTWIALSHCWGNEFLRPLSTTRENIGRHKESIPMDILPKTFHDAVIVTRALDIRYLWIDSLCIIQDDAIDKNQQLPIMGQIYEDAYVTILAAEATNCSDGLFCDASVLSYSLLKTVRKSRKWQNLENESFNDPHEMSEVANMDKPVLREGIPSVLQRVELPLHRSDEVVGSFYVSITEDFEQFPRYTPLFARAWVMQEWILSRRSILFLKDAIVWSCQRGSENERGDSLSLTRPKLDDWQQFVCQYTLKDLTYGKDRLNAINGLANIMQRNRPDKYFAGLWDGDMPNALLWRVRGDKNLSQELSHLPSWSWARHSGPMCFQLLGNSKFNGSESRSKLSNVCKVLGLTGSGALQLQTSVLPVIGTEEFRYHPNSKYKSFLKSGFRGYSSARQVRSLRESSMASLEASVLDREGLSVVFDTTRAIGWADWDSGRVPQEPLSWIPLKLERDCIQLQGSGVTDAFHVLYVRHAPSSVSGHRLERVGMGVIIKTTDLEDLSGHYTELE